MDRVVVDLLDVLKYMKIHLEYQIIFEEDLARGLDFKNLNSILNH